MQCDILTYSRRKRREPSGDRQKTEKDGQYRDKRQTKQRQKTDKRQRNKRQTKRETKDKQKRDTRQKTGQTKERRKTDSSGISAEGTLRSRYSGKRETDKQADRMKE